MADAITTLRIPLAIAFPLVHAVEGRITLLVVAGASDLGDGWVARRFGASRIGGVLDPVVDKLFMAAAFSVVLFSGELAWYEIVGVLARDIVASVAFFLVLARGVPAAVPARAGGKAVTLLQLTTLLAFLLHLPQLRPLAWATAAVALYAIYDYHTPFFKALQNR